MSEWQTIESAPKDGTAVLLLLTSRPDRNYTVQGICDEYAVGFWIYGHWKSIEVEDCGSMGGELTGWMSDYVSIDLEPSHWMSLPEPPNAD